MAWSPPDTIKHTLDDWLATPEGDGNRYELIEGRLVVTPIGNDEHQRLQKNIIVAFGIWESTFESGEIRGASNVVLSPENAVVPDAMLVLNEHLDRFTTLGIDGPPDLAVEILSPSTRSRDLKAKRAIHERFGVPEYWLIEPKTRTITCLVPRAGLYETAAVAHDHLISPTIPQLEVSVTKLFAQRRPTV